jgi:hypothetical protein
MKPLPATNAGAPYLTTFFVGRCGKITDLDRLQPQGTIEIPRNDGKEHWNFPHLPTKNVVRYGAPAFVTERSLEISFTHPLKAGMALNAWYVSETIDVLERNHPARVFRR